MLLEANLVLTLIVETGESEEVGNTPRGYLKVVPIKGGSFFGVNVKGKVLPGGYDWNTVINNDTEHHLSKYILKTDDGTYISIENEGYLELKEEHSNRIKTSSRFEVTEGKYDWLNSGVYVGSLEVGKTESPSKNIKIFKMK
ncbi:DUF3237 domain-containing protein [Clostridium cellulovorans]|uniref:UPF0311 protein Clocel_4282 n=1 Tax=Clostridium cellulovorans (strain ATCC 35296 / DSM 3052 / OCM 3 / 743B) TaxID=573061 RepID=D9SNE9_CLOC7|nr:DUF3237 domain-containing protein [Clostridium cellulovorans]ADL53941.1 hypothetical protein Clocel_4282 [Clostridium cellulovorans 743B]